MAEVVLRAKLADAGLGEKVVVDSAGTGDWHVGQRMNPPARAQLERRGYDGSAHRARQFDPAGLAGHDLILAMDASNLATLRHLSRDDAEHRIRLFGDVAGMPGAEVPDPYGGGPEEFGRVLEMLETGMTRVADQLREVLRTPAAER